MVGRLYGFRLLASASSFTVSPFAVHRPQTRMSPGYLLPSPTWTKTVFIRRHEIKDQYRSVITMHDILRKDNNYGATEAKIEQCVQTKDASVGGAGIALATTNRASIDYYEGAPRNHIQMRQSIST
jgi:hypothetical protein